MEADVSQPSEFCRARLAALKPTDDPLWARTLDWLIAQDYEGEEFEYRLADRALDGDPSKERSRQICSQLLLEWRLWLVDDERTLELWRRGIKG